jgi:hypothetical protein
MLLATHALTGTVIGKNINNPYLIALTALVFHFLMDTLRHGEYINLKSSLKEAWKPFLDLFIGVVVVFLMLKISPQENWQLRNILVGFFFSILPDSLTFFYWKLKCKFLKKIIEFHNWVHRYPRFSPEREWSLRNLRNDIIISLLMIALFLIL